VLLYLLLELRWTMGLWSLLLVLLIGPLVWQLVVATEAASEG